MILNLCIIIQTKSWIFLSIISLWFFQMFNLCLTLLLSKLDIYCIVSSLITQLLFMRCQRFKFCLYFLNMKKFLINKKKLKNDIAQAVIHEMGYACGICQVPRLDELLNANIDEPLYWDPVVIFKKNFYTNWWVIWRTTVFN